jgi:hypothetical protein
MLDFEEDVGGGKPKKALILGLGTRVRACKKLIGEAMNSKEPELMELSKLRVHQLIQAPIFAASSHVHGRRFILTSNPQIPLEMREPLHPTLAAHSLDFVHLSTLGREFVRKVTYRHNSREFSWPSITLDTPPWLIITLSPLPLGHSEIAQKLYIPPPCGR